MVTPTALPWPVLLPLMLATAAAKSSPALLAAALPLTLLLTFTFLLTGLLTASSSALSTCGHHALRVNPTRIHMSVHRLACTAIHAGFASLTCE